VGSFADKDGFSKQCREIFHLNDIFSRTKNPLRGKYVSSRHLQQRFAYFCSVIKMLLTTQALPSYNFA